MTDLSDLIAAGDQRDASFAQLPDFSSLTLSPGWADSFSNTANFGDIFGNGAPVVGPVETLSTGGGNGLSGLFADITNLVQIAYQGEAQVNQQKLLNKIAAARLNNQLQTVKTTPNLWLVLGAVGLGAFVLTRDTVKSRRR